MQIHPTAASLHTIYPIKINEGGKAQKKHAWKM